MNPIALELRDVRKRYPNGTAALDGVSFELAAGRVLVLLGTSGSGKTTALKTINRLIDPDSGSVRVLDEDVLRWDKVALRRRIGYVIQEVGLLPHLTIGANAALVPSLLGWPEARRRERSRELLSLVGLDPERFSPLLPKQLSGGQRQRVGIARALAADPPILLMDEPFGALDPITRRRLQDEFRELQRRLAKTVVLVTHDVQEALRLGDEIGVMDAGRLVERAEPERLRRAPESELMRAFLATALS
jgi:osmoprotectant transport system ATP-binding protein